MYLFQSRDASRWIVGEAPCREDVAVAWTAVTTIGDTEEFQVIHYEVSQEYRPHYDSYDMLNEHGRLNTVRGGNRLITVLLYLSDVDEGGGDEEDEETRAREQGATAPSTSCTRG